MEKRVLSDEQWDKLLDYLVEKYGTGYELVSAEGKYYWQIIYVLDNPSYFLYGGIPYVPEGKRGAYLNKISYCWECDVDSDAYGYLVDLFEEDPKVAEFDLNDDEISELVYDFMDELADKYKIADVYYKYAIEKEFCAIKKLPFFDKILEYAEDYAEYVNYRTKEEIIIELYEKADQWYAGIYPGGVAYSKDDEDQRAADNLAGDLFHEVGRENWVSLYYDSETEYEGSEYFECIKG